MMKRWKERLFGWFFQLENEIMVPFLSVGILVIGSFFAISFYSGYTMQVENQKILAETLFDEINRDVAYLKDQLPEECLREKYNGFGGGLVRITDAAGQVVNYGADWAG